MVSLHLNYARRLLAVLPFVLVAGGWALEPRQALTQYHLDVWTEREGLPQGSVQAITQTSDGYLWIGTRDGLARFDGVAFAVFRAETTPGLRANDIRALREDRQHRLWIGTFNGGVSCYANGKFLAFTRTDGLPSSGVLDIFEDSRGDLWVGTWNGIARWDSGRFVAFGNSQGLKGRAGLSICEDTNGVLYAATDAAVHRWTGERFEVLPDLESAIEGPLREVYADRHGSVWVATVGSGLFRLRGGTPTKYTTQDGLPDNKLRGVLEDRDGNIWVATWRGLCRFTDGVFSTLNDNGLPYEHVDALFEDREGNLWIGTRGGGLARLKEGRISNFTTREGLTHNYAKCVLEDRGGAVWIGTHGGGLSRYQSRRFTNFTTEHGLASPFVRSVEQDREGNIWVGTARPAVLHVFREGKFVKFGYAQGLRVWSGIRALHCDRDNNLWIGGDGGALCRFRDGVFKCFTSADGLPSVLVRVIRQDRNGDVWIGTNDGLCRYRDGSFTTYTTEHGLAHDAVYCIEQDADGALWLGTQCGLSRYADGKFRSYFARDGLLQNPIYRILDDGENLWMSSNRGVFSVLKRSFADFDAHKARSIPCVLYGVTDGMKTAQCEGGTQPAGCKTRDAKLWFPTANGVSVIDPRQIRAQPPPSPVLIEHAWAAAQELKLDQRAKLSPGTREFRFQYTAPSLTAPEKMHFKYKLEGLDKSWVDAETRRTAFYNEIPPGDYTFRVMARGSDGVWSESGATFAFTLLPKFHQTVWFYGLCLMAAGFGAWTYHRHRMRRAREQFSLVLAERNRIARDLHDTLAQGFVGLAFQLEAVSARLMEAPAQAREHLTLALQMVRHSLAEARHAVMNLRSTSLGNDELGHVLAETARQMIADRPVDVQLKVSGTACSVGDDAGNELLRIGQEAITNSLKYSGARRIQIEVDYQEAGLRLRIQDDGRGFTPEDTDQSRPHFGLLGMRERARQIAAELSIRSEPGRGTEVTVEVPARGTIRMRNGKN